MEMFCSIVVPFGLVSSYLSNDGAHEVLEEP